MTIVALRPVISTSAVARLHQIAQGPWPFGGDTATPGGTVMILRPGGSTGYRGEVGTATWALPEIPCEALSEHAALWAPWPGRRAVVAASAWRDDTGAWHESPRDEVLLLAAVWKGRADAQVGLVAREGQAIAVSPSRLWHWLHWDQADALRALE